MAFITFKAENRISYGVMQEDGVFDLGRRIGLCSDADPLPRD